MGQDSYDRSSIHVDVSHLFYFAVISRIFVDIRQNLRPPFHNYYPAILVFLYQI